MLELNEKNKKENAFVLLHFNIAYQTWVEIIGGKAHEKWKKRKNKKKKKT